MYTKSLQPLNLKDSDYSNELESEVFECIKNSIKESKESREIILEKIKFENPREKKIGKRAIRQKILSLYTKEQLIAFSSKTQRRIERPKLTEREYHVFCFLSRKFRKEARKQGNTIPKASTRITYEKYIASKAWEQRRNKFWQNYPKRCSICGTAKFVHLHHMDYSKLAKEPDNHLVALCADHHAEYHKLYGVKRHMIRSTKEFINSKKLQCQSPNQRAANAISS